MAGNKSVQGKKYLWIYVITLFSISIILMTLSYFSHTRGNDGSNTVMNYDNPQIQLQSALLEQKKLYSELDKQLNIAETTISSASEQALKIQQYAENSENAELLNEINKLCEIINEYKSTPNN